MKIEIKSWLNGSVLFEGDFGSLAEALVEAVRLGTNLAGARLDRASLVGASLVGARLDRASLVGASLVGASLVGASLVGASLVGASLDRASLVGARLDRASLVGASLDRASLVGASLDRAINADYAIACTRILPEGDIIGWKKLNGGIAKLLIPADAKRSHAFGRKCRAEFAQVLEVWKNGKRYKGKLPSSHDTNFFYSEGARVTPTEKFDEEFTNECAPGIHFFITRIEAENY